MVCERSVVVHGRDEGVSGVWCVGGMRVTMECDVWEG